MLQIAQVNSGRIKRPLDDPVMAGFVERLGAINRHMLAPTRHFCGAGPMNRLLANTVTCTLIGLLSIPAMAQNPATKPAHSLPQAMLASWNDIGPKPGDQLLLVTDSNGSIHSMIASDADVDRVGKQWIGTWAAAPQPFLPGSLQSFRNQSLRLIVHTSAGGTKVRIKISNTFGDHALQIGGAHIVRRTAEADINPTSDRAMMFNGHASATVPARSMVVSDPVELDVPALSDLAISLFLPEATGGDDLTHSGNADELRLRRRGLHCGGEIPSRQDDPLLAIPNRSGCRGFASWSSHRGGWFFAHGRRRNYAGH
jgi:hypothetical protein